ncbi:prepilin-type N-terminal cleavage/methylation domain-containing protein [bacterium]|nr:prepilin-type N-terminal cleavage/methylation domain-containing protein [bacterium]
MKILNSIRGNNGFSLLELLIIISTLGVLASIVLPELAVYRLRSHNATAVSNLRNLLSTQELYYADHEAFADDVTTLETLGYKRNPEVRVSTNMNPGGGIAGQVFEAYAGHERGVALGDYHFSTLSGTYACYKFSSVSGYLEIVAPPAADCTTPD